MYALLKPLLVREELLKRGMRIFNPSEFSFIFKVPSYKTKRFLEKQIKEGLLVRLKRSIYALKTDIPIEEEIANRLYKPSYLSFEYALAYYNILPEMPYVVTSAITKPTRTFSVGHKTFSYFKIKKNAYAGYVLIKRRESSFLIAEAEKALVDYLYFVAIGKKPFNERLNLSVLNKDKLLKYARLYNRAKLIQLIHKLLKLQ